MVSAKGKAPDEGLMCLTFLEAEMLRDAEASIKPLIPHALLR